MNAMTKVYRYLADHLTKALGAVGAAIMSLALLDPAAIHTAAVTYLGEKSLPKIGIALFLMVIFRGWYTGKKAKQLEAQPPAT
jgi:hypothetical protein